MGYMFLSPWSNQVPVLTLTADPHPFWSKVSTDIVEQQAPWQRGVLWRGWVPGYIVHVTDSLSPPSPIHPYFAGLDLCGQVWSLGHRMLTPELNHSFHKKSNFAQKGEVFKQKETNMNLGGPQNSSSFILKPVRLFCPHCI